MSGRSLALAVPTKRSSKSSKKKRSRRERERLAQEPERAAFAELEEAFFASAPPEVAEPAAEPERFDDLLAPIAVEPRFVVALRRLLVAVRAAWRRLAGAK
jgi:hypothetical protein